MIGGRVVPVAAAVVLRADGRVLLAQRPAGKAYAGYWEFPGGKLEPGETPRHALDRELAEELGLRVRRAAPWLVQRFVYPHAHVELHFFRVLEWDGDPVGHDGQAFAWQTPGAFDVAPLLPANTLVLRALLLPTVCGITMASEAGEAAFLARARAALEGGVRLIQLREKDWPAARQRAFGEALLALARPYGAKVLLNGSDANARAWGFDGVHWTSAALAAAAERPRDLLCSASCHTRDEIAKAGSLALDFALLSPVRPTPTHPGAVALGWGGFEAAVAGAALPVFALGGLTSDDLDDAVAHGAHGVALRRGAWPGIL
ncbi:MAG TPA: Nudix family hydrolase [Casimicrobiaceae bacterium]|nr:Nudix family hydrolase [Casimicrobiaceae bacterium]